MIACITGASRGIGRAIAFKFAACGYDLLLTATNPSLLKSTADEIIEKYPSSKLYFKHADLSEKENAQEFAKWCLTYSAPDVLVNNAGTFLQGNCLDAEEGSLEKMIAVNLYSAYWITKIIAPAMMKRNKGHIFNMCSVASLKAYPGGGGYSISKFALNGFSQNLRNELKPYGVKVTAIFPGAVLTDSWEGFDNSSNRIMEAEDIAETIFAATTLSPQATIEEIIIRPQLGDL